MRKLLVCGLAFLVVLCIGPPAKAVTTTFFDFNNDNVADTSITRNSGESFTAEVFITHDGTGGGLTSAGVTLLFDPAFLEGSSPSVAMPPWILSQGTPSVDNAAGTANIGGGHIVPQTTSPLQIGTVEFLARDIIGTATSSLSMTELFPDLATFDSTVTGNGTVLDPDILYGSASVTVIGVPPPPPNGVPEPMTMVLLAGGLLAMIPLKRKLKGN